MGEIKFCPNCEKEVETTCAACGCGRCTICDYRWTCLPNFPFPNTAGNTVVNSPNYFINTTKHSMELIKQKETDNICCSECDKRSDYFIKFKYDFVCFDCLEHAYYTIPINYWKVI